ncbi:MAG: hypothetical protein JRI92_12130 [Deltaproteobacteria bacterium]|nr:hypothetical protein [Deltaproteobacteria bacterium]
MVDPKVFPVAFDNRIYPSKHTSIVKLPVLVLEGIAILGPLVMDMSLWFLPVINVGMAP